MPQYLYRWFTERLPLEAALNLLKKKSVPVHRYNLWYYLGNILLTCIIMQIITGIILLFHYQPTTATAYESIRVIILEVRYGWLIRAIHKWAAYIMIATAWCHLFSTFFLKSYRRPRELIWLTGIALFIILMGLGFTGYLLPWSEHAFFATRVGTGIAGQIPLFGEYLKFFLRGGEEIGNNTLTRIFAIHVALLPLLLLLLTTVHLILIQFHSLSVPPKIEKNKSLLTPIPFFPEFILRDLAISCWLIGIVVILAVFYPSELGKPLDLAIAAPSAVIPEWYFLFMFKTLQLMPARIGSINGAQIGILLLGSGFLFILCTPFLDYQPQKTFANFFTLSGTLILIFILVMTILAYIEQDLVIPKESDINYLQSMQALAIRPGALIFLTAIVTLGRLLWIKADDLKNLRMQNYH